MAAPFASLESKLAHATALVVESLDIDELVGIREGQDTEDKPTREVICTTGEAQELEEGTGVFAVPLSVIVRCPAAADEDVDDPKTFFDTLVATVRDGLFDTTICDLLNEQVDDFTAQGYRQPSIGTGISGDMFEATFGIEIICCASDL